MSRVALHRRTLVGMVLMLVGVIIGGTVQSTTPNGRTLIAIIIVGVGGYLWATAAWMRDHQ